VNRDGDSGPLPRAEARFVLDAYPELKRRSSTSCRPQAPDRAPGFARWTAEGGCPHMSVPQAVFAALPSRTNSAAMPFKATGSLSKFPPKMISGFTRCGASLRADGRGAPVPTQPFPT
jgi:hypothetical protein